MIITTTPTIEGKQIVEYKRLFWWLSARKFSEDLSAGLRNIFGGRAEHSELIQARRMPLPK